MSRLRFGSPLPGDCGMVLGMRRVRWVVLAWAAALAAPAHAEPAPAPATYALSWVRGEGAEECPAGRALVAEVERRLGRKVFDVSAERSFEVQVTSSGGRYHSDVYVRDAVGQAIGHRTLDSDEPGCGALFGATALAIALVIDPDAAQREASDGQGVAAFEAPVPAPPPPPPAPPARPAATAVTPAPPPPVTALPGRALVTVSLRGQLSGGLVPGVSPGLGLSFTARPGQRFGFVLAGHYSAPRSVTRGIGIFELGLTRLSAGLTFDAVQDQRLRLILSAGPSLGAYHLAVREPTPVTDPGDFLFAAVEAGAELQVSVSSSVFLDVGGQALAALKRQEFLARGQTQAVWSQPWLGGLAFLGVGARFP